ncbi:hypothetical protein LP123_03065 [Moraxella bovis]|uniref:Uncharacterized protein n=2 Tax=Moraxella bovis TaxID=476 RepID=A0AAX3EW49_MORBO|nr:hypothetical protein [Moraxella bovis]AWY19584.1 hypothetical protein DQF64_03030 [Moraxella bovis]UYZ75295.1 hypothetical protein LP093_11185 [Moraxella bovis]UYZ78772.1 hypothetical protein LP115_02675 [Moraxella bovis]UYZ87254.1 hypothetical protein LP094_02675 [Moraxella bovis]UYZ89992.1 hypothetical protein LP114_02560 [Moraxella bovis]
MKKLFKYDFLDKNKGIQSAFFSVSFCVFIAIPKYNTLFIIVLGVIWAALLCGIYAFLDKWLAKQNFNQNQLSIFNKIGWIIYIISLMVAGYLVIWQD